MYPKAKITIGGRHWEPVTVQPDNEGLASVGERAMVRFSRDREPEFFVAPRHELHAGWVVGVPL